jgi:hypothetical protein
MSKKVSVFCIWRDSENTIYKTLKQLENLESIDGFEFSYFFYENDSKDKTVDILKEWLSKRSGNIKTEILNASKFGSTTDPERMKFLCECRNKCKNLALDNKSDYSLLIDSDIEFNNDNFLLQIESLNKIDNAVMTTANVRQNIPDLTFNTSLDSYYDTYAFRDGYGNNGLYWSDSPFIRKENRLGWMLGQPQITMSSFGGFAIIKSNIFNKIKWHSDFHCDHVNMCYDISRHGSIYIIPRSKVYVNLDLSKLDIESFAKQAKSQKEIYDKYF